MWLAATNGFLLAWEIKAAPPQPWLRLALVRTAMAKADEDRSSKPIDPSSLPIIEALAGKLVATVFEYAQLRDEINPRQRDHPREAHFWYIYV